MDKNNNQLALCFYHLVAPSNPEICLEVTVSFDYSLIGQKRLEAEDVQVVCKAFCQSDGSYRHDFSRDNPARFEGTLAWGAREKLYEDIKQRLIPWMQNNGFVNNQALLLHAAETMAAKIMDILTPLPGVRIEAPRRSPLRREQSLEPRYA